MISAHKTNDARLNCSLTRSQSDDLIVRMIAARPFVVASWRGGEPIVHGFGKTEFGARNCALLAGAPQDAELCSRVVGETLVWRGPSGRTVTVEHLLTVDD